MAKKLLVGGALLSVVGFVLFVMTATIPEPDAPDPEPDVEIALVGFGLCEIGVLTVVAGIDKAAFEYRRARRATAPEMLPEDSAAD